MATRKKRSTSKKKKGGGRLAAALSMEWLQRQHLRIAAWGVAGVAAAVGWLLGVPALEASMGAESDGGEVRLVFANEPAWATGDVHAMLELIAKESLTHNTFDQRELAAVLEDLDRSGWFEEVRQVRRRSKEEVEVDAAFVRPFAVVRDRDGDHLVDVRGKLLPRTYARGGAPEHWVVIEGAHFARPHRPGVAWDGADVTAAIELLLEIDSEPWRDQITTVDISEALSTEKLALLTDVDARILWGSPVGEEEPLEPSAEEKLKILENAFTTYGRVDLGDAREWYFLQEGYISRER